jgi:hypothetical protein
LTLIENKFAKIRVRENLGPSVVERHCSVKKSHGRLADDGNAGILPAKSRASLNRRLEAGAPVGRTFFLPEAIDIVVLNPTT